MVSIYLFFDWDSISLLKSKLSLSKGCILLTDLLELDLKNRSKFGTNEARGCYFSDILHRRRKITTGYKVSYMWESCATKIVMWSFWLLVSPSRTADMWEVIYQNDLLARLEHYIIIVIWKVCQQAIFTFLILLTDVMLNKVVILHWSGMS